MWHDRKISAGLEWENEIDTYLQKAHIILLLISPDFLASQYCFSIEMKQAIERHERGEARVIPIILRPVYWQGAPFGKLEVLPTDAKPVTGAYWHNQDEAFFSVAEGIRKVVEEMVKKRSAAPNPTTKSDEKVSLSQTERFKFKSMNFLLTTARHESCLTQAQLAQKLDVPALSISRWESGRTIPSPYYRKKLCELYGKTPEELGWDFNNS